MKKIMSAVLMLTVLVACKKEIEKEVPEVEASTIQSNIETSKDSIKLNVDSLEMVKKDSIAAVKKLELEKNKKSKKFSVYKGDAFSYWPIKASDSLTKLFYKTFTKEQQYTIAALNRIDTDHIKGRDTLVIPNEFKAKFMDYTPFPKTLSNATEIPNATWTSSDESVATVSESGLVNAIGAGKVTIKVVANEAVELAKKYSNEKSPSFINGVLSKIVNNKE